MMVVDPISVPDPGHLHPREPDPYAEPPSGDRASIERHRLSPGDDFDFQQSSRANHSDQAVPLGGVPRALREAAELAGLDPCAALYNEALRYAQEGHLRLARERLQMLLCMAPDDGEARLVLARVFVAGQRWSEALTALDEATNCGVDVPMSLRRAVEDHLRAERAVTEEQQNALKAREQGEVKALRQEARRLRSDHAAAACRISELEREVKKWAWATASVSALGIVFIVGSLVLGGGDPEASPEAGSAVPPSVGAAPAPVGAVPVAPAPAPVEAAPVADLGTRVAAAVDQALGAESSTVGIRLEGDRVVLSGEVSAHRQRKAAERAVAAVDGVTAVDVGAVKVLARSQGATHVVGKGDTLSHLAYAYYGDSTLAHEIEKSNALAGKPLRIGQKLVIPPVDAP
ncbi:MAG: tetratricopeptide repeat protein [Myxococcota bacterium]